MNSFTGDTALDLKATGFVFFYVDVIGAARGGCRGWSGCRYTPGARTKKSGA